MKSFEYGDSEVGRKEVLVGVANMVIGFGVLTLPRTVANATHSIDGWISISLGGLIVIFFAGVLAKLISRFPKKNLYEFTSLIINKPIATILTFLFASYMMLFVCYEMRVVAEISKLYLFDRTPTEVICFVFFLVTIYAVSGPSTVILRLNLLFIPIILFIILLLIVMNIGFFEFKTTKPFFQTGWSEILRGSKETIFSFLGFEILLFYNAFINDPKNTVKFTIMGMSIPLLLYLLVFVFVVGVFGVEVAENTLYPTAELAKRVEIPGGFFERFESVFFTIWVVTLFSTASMAFDVTLLAFASIFKKIKRMTFIFFLSPLIYIIAMSPQNFVETSIFGEWISYLGIGFSMFMPLLLLVIAMMRGVKGNG
ncbi:GerAB/ArcD/ProY family transporter [Peribacillus asahii]|uniref:GerAB/ArcD/ProY family transporter n=1 Tax=Peribacillus asahii TaxID=228899 RepID=UPI002079B682|nr:endospore germination permease [Peribacillus asahii]USK70824.1 spore germination protein [Peribacillus asahii]